MTPVDEDEDENDDEDEDADADDNGADYLLIDLYL